MRLLLDSHIFCWWYYEPERLSRKAFRLVKEAEEVLVSSASIWEISIKARLGKISADPEELFRTDRVKRFPRVVRLCEARTSCREVADASCRSIRPPARCPGHERAIASAHSRSTVEAIQRARHSGVGAFLPCQIRLCELEASCPPDQPQSPNHPRAASLFTAPVSATFLCGNADFPQSPRACPRPRFFRRPHRPPDPCRSPNRRI